MNEELNEKAIEASMNRERSDPRPISAKQPNQPQLPATSSGADVEAFLDRVNALDPAVKAGDRGRLRSRCHDELAADLGQSLPPPG